MALRASNVCVTCGTHKVTSTFIALYLIITLPIQCRISIFYNSSLSIAQTTCMLSRLRPRMSSVLPLGR